MKSKAAASRGLYSTLAKARQIIARLLTRARNAGAGIGASEEGLVYLPCNGLVHITEVLHRDFGVELDEVAPIIVDLYNRGLIKIEGDRITLVALADLIPDTDANGQGITI